ncbi:MAG: hypothetical protein WAK48_18305 [Candidatus Acidiferrum sp.]|jgi:hypothetical protein
MADYRVERDATVITILTEHAAKRGAGPNPPVGERMVFKTRHDTARFVRDSEAEGYTFTGKENLAGIL